MPVKENYKNMNEENIIPEEIVAESDAPVAEEIVAVEEEEEIIDAE